MVISGSATSVQIESLNIPPDGGVKMVWSTAPSDNLQASVLATLLLDGGYSNPAAIYRNDSYGSGLDTALLAALHAQGSPSATLGKYPFMTNDTDIVPQAQAASSQAPAYDAVVVIGTPTEADTILNSWAGPTPAWFFSDNAQSTALLAGIDGGFAPLVGSLGTGPATAGAGNGVYSDFSSAYMGEFHLDPASASYIANTYDAAMLIALGIDYAQTQGDGTITGAKIATALTLISFPDAGPIPLEPVDLPSIHTPLSTGKPLNIVGASGNLDFDPTTGVAPGPINIWQVAPDGGIVTVSQVNP
jgi:branched-chain amino acid transport system substrate-binding protein